MDVGLYGKLPSHGDFLRRRVPEEFVNVWDAWLQQCIAASRSDLGERWLDLYLVSPVWRFACDAGACGPQAYAGVMVPSVDRVGRYFPLSLMWEVPEGITPLQVARVAERWFDAAERLVIETLAADQVEFDEFEQRVGALGDLLDGINWRPQVELNTLQAAQLTASSSGPWQLPLGVPSGWDSIAEQLLSGCLRRVYHPLVLFWTDGSASIEPSCLVQQGLPAPHQYAALLDGSWEQQGWNRLDARVVALPAHDATLVSEFANLSYRSSALSDVGHVRSVNQDAFLERADLGLWVVADGMGGYRDGDVASRMVCDALAEMPPRGDLDAFVDEVRERLSAVNTYLRRAAKRESNPVQSGSTVVVLLACAQRCAILWAGDSRVYRLRAGRFEQLTRDHSWAEDAPESTESDRNVVTRAVGGEEDLALEVRYERVQAGDRYLLCSDGLSRDLSAERIRQLLSQSSLDHCVHELIGAALDAGGADNVTALVVDVTEETRDGSV